MSAIETLTNIEPRIRKLPKWAQAVIETLCEDLDSSKMPKTCDPRDPEARTASGYRIFSEQDHRRLRVVEATLTVPGAHAFLFAGGPGHEQDIMLSVADAKTAGIGLLQFAAEAEAGLLHAPPTSSHHDDDPPYPLDPVKDPLMSEMAAAGFHEVQAEYPNGREFRGPHGQTITCGSPLDRMPQTVIGSLIYWFGGRKAEALDKILDEKIGRFISARTPNWFNRKFIGL